MLEKFESTWDAARWLSNDDAYTTLEATLDLEETPPAAEFRVAADAVDHLCCGFDSGVFFINGRLTLVIASWGH